MSIYDPLSPSSSPAAAVIGASPLDHSSSSSQAFDRDHHQPHHHSTTIVNISPLAPRSPLPGQRPFRPQAPPLPPFDSAWSVHPTAAMAGEGEGDDYDRSSESTNWTPQRPPALVARSARANDADRERKSTADDDQDSTHRRPAAEDAARGTVPASLDGFVRLRVLGLEKNRRDVYVKFSAESNLPSFHAANYRSVSRSYSEFSMLAEALAVTNPQCIVPALPLAQTSATTDEEDDRLVKIAFQQWFARITSEKALAKEEELRRFIEGEFGYTPTNRQRRKTPPTFHFPRGARRAEEQDDDLTLAKSATMQLEAAFLDMAKVIEKVSKARRAAAIGYADVGTCFSNFSTTERFAPLANGIKRLARTTKVMGDLQGIQATNDLITLGDALAYQAMNARSAKDTLINRHVLLDEHRSAVKATIAKRRNIEKLKSSSSIKADKVDEALDDLEEARKHELLLCTRLTSISHSLLPSLSAHSQQTHASLLLSLLQFAKANLVTEQSLLKDWEGTRVELKSIGVRDERPVEEGKGVRSGNGGASGGVGRKEIGALYYHASY